MLPKLSNNNINNFNNNKLDNSLVIENNINNLKFSRRNSAQNFPNMNLKLLKKKKV